MLIKNFCKTLPLQNKNTKEFLRGSYSDHFQWFTQVELTAGFHSWLTVKIVCYNISCTRKTYSVVQVL